MLLVTDQMEGLDKEVAEFFAAEGQRLGFTKPEGSRRVILHGLPPNISLGMVLEAVSALPDTKEAVPGGIVSAQIFQDPACHAKVKLRCAMIEFVHPSAALSYADFINESDIYFEVVGPAGIRSRYQLQASLASSTLSPLRPDVIYMLLAEQTRSIRIPVFPEELVWELLCILGLHLLTRVEYRLDMASLHLEFVSIFESARAYRLLHSGLYPQFAICDIVPPQFSVDSTQRSFDTIAEGLCVHGRFEPRAFDQAPFNISNYPHETAWTPCYHPSTAHLICEKNDIMPYELMGWLFGRRCFKPEHYHVIGSGIVLRRTAYSWSIDPNSHTKLLLSSSLDDANLSEAWDNYFRLRGLPNLRRYGAYGAIASGGSNSDQSDSGDEDEHDAVNTSDTEDCRADSLLDSLPDIGVTCTKPANGDSSCHTASSTVFVPKHEDSQVHAAHNIYNTSAFSWIMAEATTLEPCTRGGRNEVLIPDIDSSEPGRWDPADYADWLYTSETASCPQAKLGGGHNLEHIDLISFDYDMI